MDRIIIRREENGYSFEFQGPCAKSHESIFGGTKFLSCYSKGADPKFVLRRLTHDFPGHRVVLCAGLQLEVRRHA